MNIASGSCSYDGVPEDQAPSLRRAIEAAVRAHGGKVRKYTQRVLSPELKEIGLDDVINHALVSEGVDTREKLEACTEDHLLSFKGKVNYKTLRAIILALANHGAVLAGCTIALDDLIELSGMADGLYIKAKKGGYHSITQLTEADALDLRRVFARDLSSLRGALAAEGRSWGNLHADRTLRDFRLTPELLRKLRAAGIHSDTLVAPLTQQSLRERLCPSREVTSEAERLIRWLTSELRHCCYTLSETAEPEYDKIGAKGGRHKPTRQPTD